MGFRNGAYAKVWSVEKVSDTNTKLRISISRKNKQTNEYETDFQGFVSCVGSAAAKSALQLREGDRIKLGDTDVRTRYDKDKSVTYTNFTLFSFETEGSEAPKKQAPDEVDPSEGFNDDRALPF